MPNPPPSFAVSTPLRSGAPARRARTAALSPRRALTATAGEPIPNSPAKLVRSWADSRTVSSTVDLSRRFISVLFLSNNCQRAAFAEKQLSSLAEKYSISRRLLILSAGIHSNPGDLLPASLINAASKHDIDLSDERPCAAFEISDVEYYDFVVVVDRDVKDQVLRLAEAFAHKSGGHLYEWERKVRLLCDFDGTMPERSSPSAGLPIDVPAFDEALEMERTMEVITYGCESIVRSLLTAGL